MSDKSCPGSLKIREPRPEYMNCPNCGHEVEIWTDELKATCSRCKTKVFRKQEVSCIDWCPRAKECVGPEVYERLRPGIKEDLSGTPLDVLKREHERVLETLGLLRGANLCLKLGELSDKSPVHDRGVNHLVKVLEFFQKDVELHLKREEDVLFPYLDRHLEAAKSPARVLAEEHVAIRQKRRQLEEYLAKLKANGHENAAAIAREMEDTSGELDRLLREHIKKEDASLLPISRSLLGEQELGEISEKFKTITV
ncbi:MAG: hemerythrin domain-containing protein [Chloroflexi bacterium]|nr:hemerythrin domain-containing protein [Chloroflexota bacterium]